MLPDDLALSIGFFAAMVGCGKTNAMDVTCILPPVTIEEVPPDASPASDSQRIALHELRLTVKKVHWDKIPDVDTRIDQVVEFRSIPRERLSTIFEREKLRPTRVSLLLCFIKALLDKHHLDMPDLAPLFEPSTLEENRLTPELAVAVSHLTLSNIRPQAERAGQKPTQLLPYFSSNLLNGKINEEILVEILANAHSPIFA